MIQQTISFILDDRLTEIDFSKSDLYKPTTTVLNYLRSLPGHKGVKEGCAEGDCGACTIVVAEPGGPGKLKYKALDSCLLFLPTLHGKQLITVENLAEKTQEGLKLHPVQKNLVDFHGSQCGYCTPGIAMSMFSLYKNNDKPSRETIDDALTGNLCRCTGYGTIVEATQHACSQKVEDQFSKQENLILDLLKKIKQKQETIEIISAGQKYLKPFTLPEALRLRQEYPEAVITGGATDIALRQTKGKEMLREILDISDVDDSKSFMEDESGYIFGAGLTVEDFKNLTESRLPAFNDILKVFGSLQIRNVATIAGNIGSASPIGDLLPLLFVHKASVRLRSSSSERIISVEEFIRGYRKTDLRANELITEVMIPKPETGVHIKCYKVSKRKDLDISTICGAFRLELDGAKVKEMMIAFGGMDAVTRRAIKAENYLAGRSWNRQEIEKAIPVVQSEFTPISDARAGADYRALLAGNLLLKFYVAMNHFNGPDQS